MLTQFIRVGRRLFRRPYQRLTLLYMTLLLLLTACQPIQPVPTPVVTAPTATLAAGGPQTEATKEATSAIEQETATPEPSTQASLEASVQPLAAYVRGGVLYLQTGPNESDVVPVEDCSANDCVIYHLDWSPTRTHLLYYVGGYNNSNIPPQIRMADATGTVQTVTDQAAYVQPAAWSWDGSDVVYRTNTERFATPTDGPAGRILELWTVNVADDGTLGEPEQHGEVTFGEGCGGGGRSESANAYEREGGFAYGYLSGIIAWTPDDILLYSDNCTSRGVSRFDLANDVPLDPYDGNLRSLSLNAAGDAWVAIDSDNRIVSGSPTSLDMIVIPSSAAPEMVFYGKESGTIYYTTLEITGSTDLIDQAANLDPAIMIFPYFDRTEARLIALDPATGEELELYASGGYAYARVTEAADGSVIFSRVQDTATLQAAMENGTLTAENWRSYLPTVDIYVIPVGSTEAAVRLIDAAQYTPIN